MGNYLTKHSQKLLSLELVYFSITFKNQLATFLKNTSLKMDVIVLFFCDRRRKFTKFEIWPRGYKTFMLNSTEHEISAAHKN